MNTIRTEKELAKQIENNADMIVIESSLKNKVIRIKATGKAAWIVAIGAIGVAVTSFLSAPATRGVSIVSSFVGASAAVTTLGLSTTTSAILIAIAAVSVYLTN